MWEKLIDWKVLTRMQIFLFQFLRIGGHNIMVFYTYSMTPLESLNILILVFLIYFSIMRVPHKAMSSALLFLPCPFSHQKWNYLPRLKMITVPQPHILLLHAPSEKPTGYLPHISLF